MYACLWVCGLHVMQLVKTAMFPMSWESWSSGLVRAAGGIKTMDPPTDSLKNGSWNLAETVELERRNQGCFFFHFADYLPTCASIPFRLRSLQTAGLEITWSERDLGQHCLPPKQMPWGVVSNGWVGHGMSNTWEGEEQNHAGVQTPIASLLASLFEQEVLISYLDLDKRHDQKRLQSTQILFLKSKYQLIPFPWVKLGWLSFATIGDVDLNLILLRFYAGKFHFFTK